MSRQPRLLTMIVLACALFLRVLVPAGWMPAPKNGAFAIELCSAAAPAQAIEHAGKGHHGSKGNSHARRSGNISRHGPPLPLPTGFPPEGR